MANVDKVIVIPIGSSASISFIPLNRSLTISFGMMSFCNVPPEEYFVLYNGLKSPFLSSINYQLF